MINIKNIFVSLLFVLCPILISCDRQVERTPLYYDAWGICNDETDPINDCAWIKSIIQDNKDNRLIIAEVIGTLSTEVDNSELMLDELFYGYQIYFEPKGCWYSGLPHGTYDCMGNPIGGTSLIGEYFYYPDTTGNSIQFYKYDITNYNIIYEH
jgi:hypothetical protein